MKISLRSIVDRFKKLSRASVEQDRLDEKATQLASLARASQPAVESKDHHRVGRAIGFLGAMGIAGWMVTGVAAATVTVSTLVATNSLPGPIQEFSADVLEIVGIDAPRPKEKTVRDRLKVYHELTSPLINYYSNKNIVSTIDGSLKIDEVNNKINQMTRVRPG